MKYKLCILKITAYHLPKHIVNLYVDLRSPASACIVTWGQISQIWRDCCMHTQLQTGALLKTLVLCIWKCLGDLRVGYWKAFDSWADLWERSTKKANMQCGQLCLKRMKLNQLKKNSSGKKCLCMQYNTKEDSPFLQLYLHETTHFDTIPHVIQALLCTLFFYFYAQLLLQPHPSNKEVRFEFPFQKSSGILRNHC